MKLFYAARPRQRYQPAAANISSTKVDGSGMAEFALAPEPLPAVWPKWARHVSYPVGPLMPVFRHMT
jgi:hypothetical protein